MTKECIVTIITPCTEENLAAQFVPLFNMTKECVVTIVTIAYYRLKPNTVECRLMCLQPINGVNFAYAMQMMGTKGMRNNTSGLGERGRVGGRAGERANGWGGKLAGGWASGRKG